MYSDPNAPAHKLPPPPPPAPDPPKPPPPAPVADQPPLPPPAPALLAPVAPSRGKPYGACEPAARDWAPCLSLAAVLADRSVEDAEHAALAAIGRKPGVNPVVADGAARGLRAAGDAWRMLRDRECADLPLVETGLSGSLYERRLVCRIRRDIDRAETLRDRYGDAGETQ